MSEPTYFPEFGQPERTDESGRSLQKIAGNTWELLQASGGSSTDISAIAADVALIKTDTNALAATDGVAGTPAANALTVQGYGFRGTSTVTRPANTTPYSIGDVVGGALTIADIGPASGHIYITDSKFMLNITAIPSGMTSFTLHLYNVTPPSAIADNSPFTLGSGDRASYMGFVQLGTPVALGVGTQTPYVIQTGLNQGFTMPAGTSLFAYLVTATAYTPAANSETYTLTIKSVSV